MNCFVIDVLLLSGNNKACQNFGHVGLLLAGKRGERAFRAVQLVNLILFLPTLLSLQAQSWQYVANAPWDCIGYWYVLVTVGLVIILTFLRRWKEAAIVACISLAKTVLKAWVFLPYSFVEYPQDQVEPPFPFGAPWGGNQWYNISAALGILCYAYTPVFIVAETVGEAKNPKSYKKALLLATILQVFIYLVPGIMGAVMWGWSIEDPVTLEIPRDWVGILVNVFVAISSLVDYVIASLVVTAATKAWFSGMSPSPLAQFLSKIHVLSVLPGSLFALLMVIVIQNFTVLVGIITGFTIVGANTYVISLGWLLGGRDIKVKGDTKVLLYIGLVVGLPLSIFVIAGALYSVADADYDYSNFFCTSA